MSALVPVLISLAAFAAVVGIAILPMFVLSWPQRVRWIVAAQSTGYAAAGAVYSMAVNVREVTVVSIASSDHEVWIELLEVGRPRVDCVEYVADVQTPETSSMFGDWSALRTPLLMFVDESGISVHGPTASIGKLQLARTRRPGRV